MNHQGNYTCKHVGCGSANLADSSSLVYAARVLAEIGCAFKPVRLDNSNPEVNDLRHQIHGQRTRDKGVAAVSRKYRIGGSMIQEPTDGVTISAAENRKPMMVTRVHSRRRGIPCTRQITRMQKNSQRRTKRKQKEQAQKTCDKIRPRVPDNPYSLPISYWLPLTLQYLAFALAGR